MKAVMHQDAFKSPLQVLPFPLSFIPSKSVETLYYSAGNELLNTQCKYHLLYSQGREHSGLWQSPSALHESNPQPVNFLHAIDSAPSSKNLVSTMVLLFLQPSVLRNATWPCNQN